MYHSVGVYRVVDKWMGEQVAVAIDKERVRVCAELLAQLEAERDVFKARMKGFIEAVVERPVDWQRKSLAHLIQRNVYTHDAHNLIPRLAAAALRQIP